MTKEQEVLRGLGIPCWLYGGDQLSQNFRIDPVTNEVQYLDDHGVDWLVYSSQTGNVLCREWFEDLYAQK